MTDLKFPTKEMVDEYEEKWQKNLKGSWQEKMLLYLFNDEYPKNNNYEEVMLKVYLLNRLYSTRLSNKKIESLATGIMNIPDMDSRLKNGDLSILREINSIKNEDDNRGHYSFATKYCHFHNPRIYPIYDSFVVSLVCKFKKMGVFDDYNFKRNDLKDYSKFKKTLDYLIKIFDIHSKFPYQTLDHFLWSYANENKKTLKLT